MKGGGSRNISIAGRDDGPPESEACLVLPCTHADTFTLFPAHHCGRFRTARQLHRTDNSIVKYYSTALQLQKLM